MSAIRDTARLLGSYVAGRKASLAGLALAILASNGLRLANPLVLRSFIDAVSSIVAGGTAPAPLFRHAALYMAIAVAVQLLAVAAAWLGQDLGWKATNDLRLDLMRSTMAMDMAWHKEHAPGELIERVDGDSRVLMGFFSDFSIRVAGSAALLVGVLVTLFVENPWIGAAMTAFACLAAVFLVRIGLAAVPAWKASREAWAGFFGFLGERLAGREDLRGLGAVGHARDGVRERLKAWYPVRRKSHLLGYMMWTSSELVAGIGTILSLGLGAFFWRRGVITLGTVYLVYAYMELIRQPLDEMREQLEEMQKALAGTSRVGEMLALRPALSYGEAHLGGGAVGLAFRDVSFAYEPGKPVLDGVSFDVEPGTTLGIVGRTGCGKTTVGRLALRLYDRDAGEVILGGRDIRDYSRASLRRNLAVVTQDVELFDGSVRDNARVRDPSIGDDAIMEAITALGLEPWLSRFPGGLDERLGPGGAGMSAGQAQLLAMVRVFLRDPGLVILDEASSRLDPATEALIDGAVARLLRGRSSIIIAHRLSTLDRADAVLVMEAGRVVERGERAALAADPSSRFAGLIRAGAGGAP